MPAIKLFGRKWMVASDDLVFPGLFELVFRIVWIALVALVTSHYYPISWTCENGGNFVRAYLVGELTLLGLIIVLLLLLVNRSAQGSIMDVAARRLVPPLLTVKILLIIPEVAWNIMGTIWMFGDIFQCKASDSFIKSVIEGLVLFNWVLFALTLLGLALMFDPLGSIHFREDEEANIEMIYHRKVTRLWIKRFHWVFCWVRRDEHCREAFHHIAGLFSALSRNTDIVPSDFMAGLVLLRVMQKREMRELRRVQLLSEEPTKYYLNTNEIQIFGVPSWMTLENATHFLKHSMASYGWPFVMYRYPVTGLFRLCRNMVCCGCFRAKTMMVRDDNCCMCQLAGVKHLSGVSPEDILHASFQNEMFQLPFYVVADHETASIAIVIRGSISMRDVFTDLTAGADIFNAPGLPPNSMAHRGMIIGSENLRKSLDETGILEKAFEIYPHYNLVLTGHSLGAGVAVLLGLMLRPKYPDLRVYAFSTPAGVISREAARITEEFTFSVGLGDDFVMRLGVNSMENVRTNGLRLMKFCRLPKYRIMLNGFGYALFGIPTRDLESTWKTDMPPPNPPGQLPLLLNPPSAPSPDEMVFQKDFSLRRFSRTQLYTPGRILHVTYRKKTREERKAGTGGPTYAMRWATAEEFTEFRIMPRMLLDHLPENVFEALETVLKEQPAIRKNKPSISHL